MRYTVELTSSDLKVLRGLIYAEARRLEVKRFQHPRDWPARAKRLATVIRKLRVDQEAPE